MGLFSFLDKQDYAPLAKLALGFIEKMKTADSGETLTDSEMIDVLLDTEYAKEKLMSNNPRTCLKGGIDLAEAFAKASVKKGDNPAVIACIPKEHVVENTAAELERAGAKSLARLVRLAMKPA